MFGFSWRSLRPVTAFNWSKASDVLNIFLLKWRNLCSLNRSNFKLKRSNFVLLKEHFFSIIQAISVDLLYQHFFKKRSKLSCIIQMVASPRCYEMVVTSLSNLSWIIRVCTHLSVAMEIRMGPHTNMFTFYHFFIFFCSCCLFVLLHFKA